MYNYKSCSLQWRHNEHDSVSNHQPHDCLLNRLFGRKSKKTSKLRVTGLCAGNSPGTGGFPAQMAINAENVSIWWRHHVEVCPFWKCYDTLYTNSTREYLNQLIRHLSSTNWTKKLGGATSKYFKLLNSLTNWIDVTDTFRWCVSSERSIL